MQLCRPGSGSNWRAALPALAFALGFVPDLAHAVWLNPYYRGARATAMGGAFTAVADDETAMWINPAGLAGIEERSLHYLSLDIDGAYDILTAYLENSSLLTNFSIDSINALMGKNLYARGTLSPAFIIPNFAIGAIYDVQAALFMRNQSLPQITVGNQVTYGIQAATAVSFKLGKRSTRRKSSVIGELRLGLAVKALWKRGGYQQVPLEYLFRAEEGINLLTQLAWPWGSGFGADAGAMWVMNLTPQLRVTLGSAFINIGDVTYSPGGPDKEKGNFSVGAAVRLGDDTSNVLVSYEQQHLQEDIDFRLRQRLGVELKAGNLSIFGGLYQTSLTFGAAFDLWLFRITAASYGQELASHAQIETNRRYLLRFDMKLPM